MNGTFLLQGPRKYRNRNRPNQAAGDGCWKFNGTDKAIISNEKVVVGFRMTLAFYRGKHPKGDKTNWFMHEYRVNDPPLDKSSDDDMRLDEWVLCRIFKKVEGKSSKTQNEDEACSNPLPDDDKKMPKDMVDPSNAYTNLSYQQNGPALANMISNIDESLSIQFQKANGNYGTTPQFQVANCNYGTNPQFQAAANGNYGINPQFQAAMNGNYGTNPQFQGANPQFQSAANGNYRTNPQFQSINPQFQASANGNYGTNPKFQAAANGNYGSIHQFQAAANGNYGTNPQFQASANGNYGTNPQFQGANPQFQAATNGNYGTNPQFQSVNPQFQASANGNYRTNPQFQAAVNGNYGTIPQFQATNPQFQAANGNYETTHLLQASNFGTTPKMVQGDNYGTSIHNVERTSYMPFLYDLATFLLSESSENMHMASNVSPNEPSGLYQENQDTSNLDQAFGSVSNSESGSFSYEEIDDSVPNKRQKLQEDDNHPCE
uniref:NAC domain-containing protein n=1 Tax=Fagus sylvatica TaxID=28930 RepID=A0A2N9HVL1_FAGSY